MTDSARDKVFAAIKAQCEQSKGPVTVSGTLLKTTVEKYPPMVPRAFYRQSLDAGLLVIGLSPSENTITFRKLHIDNAFFQA